MTLPDKARHPRVELHVPFSRRGHIYETAQRMVFATCRCITKATLVQSLAIAIARYPTRSCPRGGEAYERDRQRSSKRNRKGRIPAIAEVLRYAFRHEIRAYSSRRIERLPRGPSYDVDRCEPRRTDVGGRLRRGLFIPLRTWVSEPILMAWPTSGSSAAKTTSPPSARRADTSKEVARPSIPSMQSLKQHHRGCRSRIKLH